MATSAASGVTCFAARWKRVCGSGRFDMPVEPTKADGLDHTWPPPTTRGLMRRHDPGHVSVGGGGDPSLV